MTSASLDLDRFLERLGGDRRNGDLALLLEQREIALHRRLRGNAAVHDRILQRREHQLAAHALLEHQRRHVLRRKHLSILVRRKLAVFLERRQPGDELLQLRIADAETVRARALLEQPLIHELVEQRIAHLGRLEHRRIEVAAERLAHPLLLLAQHVVEFLPAGSCRRRRLPPICARVAAKVIVDTEERERQRDQREDALRDVLVLVDEIEHGVVTVMRGCATPVITKKGELAFAPR